MVADLAFVAERLEVTLRRLKTGPRSARARWACRSGLRRRRVQCGRCGC